MSEIAEAWDRANIQLPHGWHLTMTNLGKQISKKEKGGGKYLYAAAVELLLNLKRDQITEAYDRIVSQERKNPKALAAKHCDPTDAFLREVSDSGRSAKSRRSRKPRPSA